MREGEDREVRLDPNVSMGSMSEIRRRFFPNLPAYCVKLGLRIVDGVPVAFLYYEKRKSKSGP
jgi:hypothetical protein